MAVLNRPSFGLTMALVNEAASMGGVDPRQIIKRDRTRAVAYARFGVIWALRNKGFGLVGIAEAVGLKDHTSVIHALRKADVMATESDGYRKFLVAMTDAAKDYARG